MNILAHIESTGESGRVHLSAETADLIVKGGKRNWIEKRQDNIVLGGKGSSQTYWLVSSAVDSVRRKQSSKQLLNFGDDGKRTVRLVEWNTEVLLNLLKQVVAMRQLRSTGSTQIADAAVDVKKTGSFLDEVTEIIALPEFEKRFSQSWQDIATVDIPKAAGQLRDYVFMISTMYKDNDFHNFEHASHVMMSVVKLLSRIVSPAELKLDSDEDAEQLHDHTYGITSDPLTQFACAVGALIHDVHHSGESSYQN
jgi:3'5'-cyclic nucleotide phosphodiesterase